MHVPTGEVIGICAASLNTLRASTLVMAGVRMELNLLSLIKFLVVGTGLGIPAQVLKIPVQLEGLTLTPCKTLGPPLTPCLSLPHG